MTTQLYRKLMVLPALALAGMSFGQAWEWTNTTVPASNKGGHGDQNWAAAANWGDGTSGYPSIASDSALSDAYTFNQSISRWQWIRLPALNQQPGGYLGTLQGGFHNSIVLTSQSRLANRLFKVANPNDYVGDWMINNTSDGVGVSSGFILPATDSFTPVLQRVRITGNMQFKVATGGTAELAYPFGEGSLGVNKSIDGLDETTGTLAITRSPGPCTELRVYGGTVSLTGRTYTGVPTCVPGAALHLDASNVDSLTVEGGIVTEWRDADGGVRVAARNGTMNLPRLHADYANGLPVVDFGVQKDSSTKIYGDPAVLGDASCLKLDSTLDGVREFFVVFADTTSTNACAPIVNVDTYARSTTPGRLFSSDVLSDRSAYAAIETADLSVDGQASSQALVADDFSKGLHVVAVSHRGDYRGVLSALGIRDPDNRNRFFGGVRIAEVIAYTSALTPDQRRQNIAYLRRKWQPAEVAKDLDYGAVTVAGESVIDVADGTTVEVGTLTVSAGVSKLVKTGGGTLVIDSYLSPDVEVEVHGGLVKFASSAVYSTPVKASDPLVWLDANTLTQSTVTEWADARGTGVISASRADGMLAATLDTTTVAGLKMVDMGESVSSADSTYFLIKNGGAMLGYAVRCGFMVYYKNHKNAYVPSSTNNALRVTQASKGFLDENWANAFAVGGRWALDGNEIIPTSCNNGEGEVHVIGFRFASNMPVNMLGADRDVANRGGIKFGEVLLYDRPLTDAEWKETESYLLKKWKNAAHPADLAAEQPVDLTLADGATLNVNLSSAGCDKLVVSGQLTLAGAGVVQAELIPGSGRLDDEYVIAEAVGGIVCDNLNAWTVNSATGVSAKLRIVDGTKLVLGFKIRGFSLIFR